MEEIRKPFIVNVFLNDRIYHPGDTVEGEVELDLRKKMLCDNITAQLYGAARVFFLSSEPGCNGPHPIAHEQKKVFVDETKVIWGVGSRDRRLQKPTLEELVRTTSTLSIRPQKLERKKDEPGFEAGRHKLQFSFDLPKAGLCVSYAEKECGIRYYVKVECYNYQQMITSGKSEFPVVCPVNWLDISDARNSKEAKHRIAFKKDGYIDVKMDVLQSGFVPAERIPVAIQIDNRSRHSVKYAHLSIERHLACFATEPFPSSTEFCSDTTGCGLPIHKIPSGESYGYKPVFFVPALIPNFEIEGMMTLRYSLKLDVSFIRKCTSKKDILCSLRVPIYVGTEALDYTAPPANGLCYNRYNGSVRNGTTEGGSSQFGLFEEPPPEYSEKAESDSLDSSEASCPSYGSLFDSACATGFQNEEKKKL